MATTSGRRRPWRRPLGWGFRLAVLALVIYFVSPQIAGAHKDLTLLGGVNLWLALLAVLLEAGSILAYTMLTRSVLPRGQAPPFSVLLRIQLSTLALSHIVPGGTAAGSPLGYRLLTASGVDGPDAGAALATQSVGSAVVLNLMLGLALLVAIAVHGYNPLYLTVGVIGIALFAAAAVAIIGLFRGEERADRFVRWVGRKAPFLNEDQLDAAMRRLVARLRTLLTDRAMLLRATVWAAANWLLDAASLWVFVGAFGHWVAPDGVFVAYGIANVLAVIPVTPAGLGVVEGVLVSLLIGFGAPRGVAVLGVIAYRLFNFWLPIPLGGVGYLTLQVHPASDRTDKLRRVGEETTSIAPLAGRWARRHMVRLPGQSDGGGPPEETVARTGTDER